ncbi:hypothetical protein CTI12_AA529120 [Artemisia annua]|uniref:Uncharacterized protein n=1 Tax=Artemisia annua TaxID=35608 RepID=A0A2U1L558_ARTAN|nr:hypothetical protein CTI12_AA529120 [Artemisia annua]
MSLEEALVVFVYQGLSTDPPKVIVARFTGSLECPTPVEVLYLVEPIDEVAIQSLQTYKEKKFVDVSKEDLELIHKF